MASTDDSNPGYWDEYTNLQHTKHQLIKHYLDGWIPKLGFWSGRIVYIDTHAGRGRHSGGQAGSPVVAIQSLLNHRARDDVLKKSEVCFFFIERDPSNVQVLQQEVQALGALPNRISVETIQSDCYDAIEALLAYLDHENTRLAPAFVFVDPYGFKVPARLLRRLMEHPRVELFINVIWRELDMALAQGDKPGMAETLDLIFDGPEWRREITSADFNERAEQAVNLLRRKIGARWATHIRMAGKNGATRYLLLHVTNHDAGRDLMKDCMWKVCPDGGFYVRRSEDPRQEFLIKPEPDLSPLRDWVLSRLATGPRHWQDFLKDLRAELWREPHLNTVIRELRRDGLIMGDGPRFVPRQNPLLSLVSSDEPPTSKAARKPAPIGRTKKSRRA